MHTIVDARTLGISPKAVLAFIWPTIVTVAGVIASWIVSGNLDTGELRGAAAGLLLAAVAAGGAALGSTGRVRLPRRVPSSSSGTHPASDELNAGRLEQPAATRAG